MLSIMTVLIGVLLAFFIIFICIYNGLIQKRNGADFAFSCIDVQLKKRFDLIPNLVETVKGYAKHESAVLREVTELRKKTIQADAAGEERFRLEDELGKRLPSVLAISENYPDLKADKNFQHLQRSLNEIEEQIAAARRSFNASIYEYNNAVQQFPSSIIANAFRFKARDFFAVAEEQKGVSVVKI